MDGWYYIVYQIVYILMETFFYESDFILSIWLNITTKNYPWKILHHQLKFIYNICKYIFWVLQYVNLNLLLRFFILYYIELYAL